jgi:hypothetical protein
LQHLAAQLVQAVLPFNRQLVLAGNTFGFFSLTPPLTDDTSATKQLSDVHTISLTKAL